MRASAGEFWPNYVFSLRLPHLFTLWSSDMFDIALVAVVKVITVVTFVAP
jgi:hypothetical protein